MSRPKFQKISLLSFTKTLFVFLYLDEYRNKSVLVGPLGLFLLIYRFNILLDATCRPCCLCWGEGGGDLSVKVYNNGKHFTNALGTLRVFHFGTF